MRCSSEKSSGINVSNGDDSLISHSPPFSTFLASVAVLMVIKFKGLRSLKTSKG
jgi:hypothetical protein